jgi:hypothetical protein
LGADLRPLMRFNRIGALKVITPQPFSPPAHIPPPP